MNRRELREEVELRFGDEDNVVAPDIQINRWINQAIKAIASSWDWFFFRKESALTTTSGQANVTITDNIRRMLKIVASRNNTDFWPLTYKSNRWIITMFPDPTNKGRPWYFTAAGLSQTTPSDIPQYRIKLAPIPDAVYNLTATYVISPSNLDSDTAVPLFPNNDFDELITLHVMRKYARTVGDYDTLAEASQQYREEFSRLSAAYPAWQDERFPHLDSTDSEDWSFYE